MQSLSLLESTITMTNDNWSKLLAKDYFPFQSQTKIFPEKLAFLTKPNTVLTLKALEQGKQDFIGCYRVKDK